MEKKESIFESLKQDIYDVVLMDVQMPEMDGLTATKELDRENRNSNNNQYVFD